MKIINIRYIFFILCIYILVFQNLLQKYISIFQYFDELLALLIFPILILKLLKKNKKNHIKLNEISIKIIFLSIALFIIGILSNVNSKIQPLNIAIQDAILVFKFIFAYLVSYYLFTYEFIENNKKSIHKHIIFLIYIFFLCTIVNYVFNIWPGDFRFGIMSNKIFYGSPTYLAAVSIFLLSMYILTNVTNKIQPLEIIMIIIVLLSTLRFKAIGAAIMIIVMSIYIYRSKKRLSLSKIAILGIFLIMISWDQISFYYLSHDDVARNILTSKSMEITKDYFPLGTGFGTYGSYISGVYYSSLYYKYDLYKIWGISKNNTSFLSDTFWPMIIGQFGLIGTIIYAMILGLIYKNIQKCFDKNNINLYISKMICIAYLLISSTSESAFVNPISIPLALIIGIQIKNSNKISKIENT